MVPDPFTNRNRIEARGDDHGRPQDKAYDDDLLDIEC
jgi:hypothetical protein